MNDLVSIIIPIYNAQNYLDVCFECLKNQTYKKFEAIFVDDGSYDNSLVMLKEFETKDERIRVYSQKNMGVSAARNMGLELANGGYIAYIDVDDRIRPDYLSKLFDAATKNSADVVCCSTIELKIESDGNESILCNHLNNYDGFKMNTEEIYEDVLNHKLYPNVVWSKLFKKEIAQKAVFAGIRYGEDTKYMYDIFKFSPKVYMLTYVGYEYIRWNNSATLNSKISEKDYERYRNGLDIIKEYIVPNSQDKDMTKVSQMFLDYSVNYLIALVRTNKKKEFFDFKKDKYFGKFSKIQIGLSFKVYIIINMFKVNTNLAWVFINLFKSNR